MTWTDLIDEISRVVQDPTAEPEKTAVAAIFVFVLLSSLIVLALLFLPEDEEEEEFEEGWEEEGVEPPSPSRRRLGSWLLGGATVLILLVIVGAVFAADRYSQDSSFCPQCHQTAAASVSWQESTHASVECMECHKSTGLAGGVETRLRALQNGLSTLSRDSSPVVAMVGYQECASCHAEDLAGTGTWNNIRVRHVEFADKIPCKQCHGQTGHQAQGIQKGAVARAVMTMCADCHDGKTASNECSTCHERDFALRAEDAGGLAKVDLPAPTTCKGCHSLERCTQCHGIEMPHPVNWADPKVHAPEGAFDQNRCTKCHDRGCTECHRAIHDNHGPTWKEEHKQATDGQWCTSRCHDKEKVGKDMCALCHEGR